MLIFTRTSAGCFDTSTAAQSDWPALEKVPVVELPKGLALVLKVQGGYFRVPGSVVIWEICPEDRKSRNGAITHPVNMLVKSFFNSTQYFFTDVAFVTSI